MTRPEGPEKSPAAPGTNGGSQLLTRPFESGNSLAEGSAPAPLPDGTLPEPTLGWPEAWDRYRCVRLLGAGGMGRVFEAWDVRLDRRVAIKLLNAERPDSVVRFLREAQAQARIEHPGICKVFEVGQVGSRPYIAMQLIHGASLAQLAPELTLEQKVLLLRQVAEAVAAAHGLGLVHRDLKPANIMVESAEDGSLRPFVVDFGLVRDASAEALTVTGDTVGTPAYMSPEQAMGRAEEIDRRTDVYSLGATLYTVLADRPPFEGAHGMEVLMKVARDEPAPLRRLVPGTPADLDTIVMKCLEKEPARRYDSARALAADLGRFLDGEPIAARPTSLGYVLARRVRKNKLLSAVVAAALVVSLGLLGLFVAARRDSARQAALAQDFGQRMEQAQGLLWREGALELHDVRPARHEVRLRLATIEAEMRRHGRAAEGPGHAALGRGLLALGEDAAAVSHLGRAWESGYRVPDVACSLGLGLGRRYQQELTKGRRIQDPALRATRLEESRRTLRDPALDYLRSCSGSGSAPAEYVKGLVAFYEGRHEEALRLAGAALARVRWLHEALLLEGDVFLERGVAARDRGDATAALRDFEAAEGAYRRAAGIARSDPRCRLRIAKAWDAVGELRRQARSGDLETPVRRAIAAVDEALAADADDVDAHVLRAGQVWSLGEARFERGLDPAAELDEAECSLKEALARKPDHAAANLNLGVVEFFRGAHAMGRGEDPRPRLRTAVAAWEKAAAGDPSDGGPVSNASLAWSRIALWELDHGHDAAAALEEAVRTARLAVKLGPGRASFLNSLNVALMRLASFQEGRGRESEATYLEAIAAGERAVAANPGDRVSANNLACARQALGRTKAARGDDGARPLLEKAATEFRKAIEESPDYPLPWFNLGTAERDLAAIARFRGEDPAPFLARSREALGRAARLDASDATVHDELARTEVLAAEIALESGRSPSAFLLQARRHLDRALSRDPGLASARLDAARVGLVEALDARRRGASPDAAVAAARTSVARVRKDAPHDTEALLMEARVGLEEVRTLVDRGRDAKGRLAEALAAADAALAANGARAETHAVRAALLLQAARAAKDAGDRDRARGAALASRTTALARNPKLEPFWTADLAAVVP